MGSVFDTAKYILEKCGTMSTMKLQKLCYYSQAWSLVWDDAPLFDEDFEAWANGPVCPSLFHHSQGKFSVSADEMKGSSENLSDGQKDTINKILEGPWQDARRGFPAGALCNTPITKESMAMYYGGL